jgi:hypothetical protein
MRKWILLLLALVLVINFVVMGVGCKAKAPETPPAKEEVKPSEAPAPPATEAAPAEKAPEAPKK